MRRSLLELVAIASLCSACADRGVVEAAGSGSASRGTDAGTSTTTEESASGESAVGSSEGPSLENCGDGLVDPGEDCDDGNDIDGDGCNVDCVVSGSVRWSTEFNDTVCTNVGADAFGGVYLRAHGVATGSPQSLRGLGMNGEELWLVADTATPYPRGPAAVRGRPGFLLSYDSNPTLSDILVEMRDELGGVVWQTLISDLESDGLEHVGVFGAASGSMTFVALGGVLLGGERLSFFAISPEGEVGPKLIVEEAEHIEPFNIALPVGSDIAVASDDTLVRYTPEGSVVWSVAFADPPRLRRLAVAPDDSVYAAVEASPDVEPDLRVHIQRYSADGLLIGEWEHSDESEAQARIKNPELAVDTRGDILVAAVAEEEDPDDPAASFRVRLAKYSPEGDVRWSNTWLPNPGTGMTMGAIDVAVRANGDAIFVFDHPTGTAQVDSTRVCRVVSVAP